MSGKGRARGPVVEVGGPDAVQKKAKLEPAKLETVIKQEPVGPLPCIFARLQMAKSKGSGSSGSSSVDGPGVVVGTSLALAVTGAQSPVPAQS